MQETTGSTLPNLEHQGIMHDELPPRELSGRRLHTQRVRDPRQPRGEGKPRSRAQRRDRGSSSSPAFSIGDSGAPSTPTVGTESFPGPETITPSPTAVVEPLAAKDKEVKPEVVAVVDDEPLDDDDDDVVAEEPVVEPVPAAPVVAAAVVTPPAPAPVEEPVAVEPVVVEAVPEPAAEPAAPVVTPPASGGNSGAHLMPCHACSNTLPLHVCVFFQLTCLPFLSVCPSCHPDCCDCRSIAALSYCNQAVQHCVVVHCMHEC